MRLFEKLRALRAFEKHHADSLSTVEDYHLIGEIGDHQAKGRPLTLKQLSVLEIGSIATVQRRLRRLKDLGLVKHRRAASDRRAVELMLSPKCVRILSKYGALMSSTLRYARRAGERRAVRRAGERRAGARVHLCGLSENDAGCRNLLVKFLVEGLERGDKGVLVAPAEVQGGILAELRHRRKIPRHLVVSEGYNSTDAQVAFFTRVLQEAKQAGQAVCFAANMSWTLSKNVQIDAILDIETQFDTLAEQGSLTGLCVYDARHFSSGDFLRAVKCHHDHFRHPIVLG